MRITEEDIENLKKDGYLIINDGGDYCWKLDLIQNKLEINYGTSYNPLNYKTLILTKSNENKIELFTQHLNEAKIYFNETIMSSKYMKRCHAKNI